MSSKITVEIGDGAIVVPNTGAFSTGQNSDTGTATTILPIIGASIIVLTLLAIVIKLGIKCFKNKKHGSFRIRTTGRSLLRLSSIALVVSLSAFAVINHAATKKDQVDAIGENDNNFLSITTEDVAIKVVREDEPVFASTKSVIKVNTATENGYKILAYIDGASADLVSTTDSSAKISSLDSAFSQALTENTWGMSIDVPENQNQTIYRGVPIGIENAIPVRVTGDTATNKNDATTVYYATYVTPELGYGIYTGASVNYIAIANVVTDDITVKYHSDRDESYYPTAGDFKGVDDSDEEPTPTFDDGSTINTVVYGNDYSLGRIDVSGDCDTVYVGNTPRISKTENIDNEGEALDGYSDNLIQVDPITFSGADALKVELYYDTESGYDFLYVFDRVVARSEITDFGDDVFYSDNVVGQYNGAGYIVFYIQNNAATFTFLTDGSATRYGYYAIITPIYYERPSGAQATESSFCRIAKSDNIDNDGNKIASLSPSDLGPQAVMVHGAGKLRVDTKYNIFSMLGLNVGGYDHFHLFTSSEMLAVGTDVIDFNGDMANFSMLRPRGASGGGVIREGLTPIDLGDGYYAVIYPIYDEETKNTLLTETSTFERKDGDYKVTTGFTRWIARIGGSDYPVEEMLMDASSRVVSVYENTFYNEYEVMSFLNTYRDILKGQTVHLYAESWWDDDVINLAGN